MSAKNPNHSKGYSPSIPAKISNIIIFSNLMNTLETILNGALGGITFGIWTAYISHRQIQQFNAEFEKKRMQTRQPL